MEKVHKLYGNSNIIVSDRDPIFIGKFWTKIFCHLGTWLSHSSSYHPQSDGKTTIVNKCLEGYIFYFGYNKQTKWAKWLPLIEWLYNAS